MELIEITDEAGQVTTPAWLAASEGVHRQLRTALPDDYAGTLARIFAGGGRMVVAANGRDVVGVALFRIHENTAHGLHLYVDDLVTDERQRSQGIGRALLQWLEQRARARACRMLALESGVQRAQAHRFYFREGMTIASFSLRKPLS